MKDIDKAAMHISYAGRQLAAMRKVIDGIEGRLEAAKKRLAEEAIALSEARRSNSIGRLLAGMDEQQAAAVVRVALQDVVAERGRQHAKWGEQNHPDGTGLAGPVAKHSPGATFARNLCERAAKRGRVTYGHILLEEVAEALDEEDPAKLRDELVQVAAVAVAWIEKIDREAGR